jgi:hypothetical protein
MKTKNIDEIINIKKNNLISIIRAYNKAIDNNNKLLELIINNVLYYLCKYMHNPKKYQKKLNQYEHLLNVYIKDDDSELSKYIQKEYRNFNFYITSTY